MERHGKLRDAQIDAIKTYLFLKIACHNRPLWRLLYDGSFNSLTDQDLDNLPLTAASRRYLKSDKAALALYEYAVSEDDCGNMTSPALAERIKSDPQSLDYLKIIKSLFYEVDYTDYLFSIPMGAGKTWLMSAFVYLNMYFALNEPDNPIFAHNFIILAPAGLKSSIIPSLKDMREFDPTFILPEPTASQIRAKIKYEILEEDNSAKNSNQIKNPNALKIQLHQPFDTLEGLVVITNAEKLYDRVAQSDDVLPGLADFLTEKEKNDWVRTTLANELRQIISGIPNLCIMIDEVHHASEEQLLRRVVSRWAAGGSFNSVLGFSGTPYLSSPERIRIAGDLEIKTDMLSNVVTYYPLVDAVGNFLKLPVIKATDSSSENIVQSGLTEFLKLYKDKFYPKTGCAKIAIYCGRIETLETRILPLAASVCQQFGLDPSEAILKFYRSSKKEEFSCPSDSESRFRALDSEQSKVRIVLLVQIGKEGWNCKSLTGVILPNENSSEKNMVLQTCCRCLREVVNAKDEAALIWLNKYNERKLDEQLQHEHHTSVAEIQAPKAKLHPVERFSRQSVVKLPALSYIQLHFSYKVEYSDDADTRQRLNRIKPEDVVSPVVVEKHFDGSERIVGQAKDHEKLQPVEYNHWLNLIAKESFFTITVAELRQYSDILQKLFDKVSCLSQDNVRVLDLKFAQSRLRSDIRKCFVSQTKVEFSRETIPCEASLLKVEQLSRPYFASVDRILCPGHDEVMQIVNADKPVEIPSEIVAAIKTLEDSGQHVAAEMLRGQYCNKPQDSINLRTYQYLPYAFDSNLEKQYYLDILRSLLGSYDKIEAYFNGDESLTEFYIDCYKYDGKFWRNIGKYYPDFVVLKRNDEGAISKVVLVETKGSVYESSFSEKREFMKEFIDVNNQNGPTSFKFMYIPEDMSEDEQYQSTKECLEKFLNS